MSTLTIPAEQAEDFRLAAADMVTEIVCWVRTQQEQLREAEERDDPARIKVALADLAGARDHLPAYGEVLRQAAVSKPEIDGDATALAFVCANVAEELIERVNELKQRRVLETVSDMQPLVKRLDRALAEVARLRDDVEEN